MFKERQLSRYVLYERALTPHWKYGVVDWKELADDLTLEESTRYAQLLAGKRTSLNSIRISPTSWLQGV